MTTRILVGDCRDTLATLPDASVHCIVTSPPYFGLRDYGESAQIGLEDTPDAYVAEMVGVFRELRRVLRDDGVAWLNLGDSYAGAGDLLGIPWRVAFALQSDGWTLRDACVWHKPNPMPESVAGTRWEGDTLRRGSWRHTSAHEMVFMLTRGMGYFCDQEAVREAQQGDGRKRGCVSSEQYASARGGGGRREVQDVDLSGRNPRNVWSITTRPYSGAHFATMPPDLAERCIKAATSAKGVCPACGAQWAPVVERAQRPYVEPSELDRYGTGDAGVHRKIGQAYQRWKGENPDRVVDHRPTCDCPPADPIPATVLDPFGGAGTTALVADRLGRDAIICELNADYAELARARVVADAPLFAAVEVTT